MGTDGVSSETLAHKCVCVLSWAFPALTPFNFAPTDCPLASHFIAIADWFFHSSPVAVFHGPSTCAGAFLPLSRVFLISLLPSHLAAFSCFPRGSPQTQAAGQGGTWREVSGPNGSGRGERRSRGRGAKGTQKMPPPVMSSESRASTCHWGPQQSALSVIILGESAVL